MDMETIQVVDMAGFMEMATPGSEEPDMASMKMKINITIIELTYPNKTSNGVYAFTRKQFLIRGSLPGYGLSRREGRGSGADLGEGFSLFSGNGFNIAEILDERVI